MISRTVYLQAFAVIDAAGIETSAGSTPWESDQHGPADIRRPQVLSKPYMAFGKLSCSDKLAFSAASLAFRDGTIADPETTGIFIGIPFGSYSTDTLYRDSVEQGNPSPALFSATLPSSPVTDIAIYYKIQGPDVVFSGGDSPLLAAVEYAHLLLRTGRLSGALVVLVDDRGDGATGNSQKGLFTAALYFCVNDPPLSDGAVFSFNHANDLPATPSSALSDRELITILLKAVKKKESVRIPVPISGFKGYISLHYP